MHSSEFYSAVKLLSRLLMHQVHRHPCIDYIKHKYNSDLNWMKTSINILSLHPVGRFVWGRFDRQTWGRFGHTPRDVLVWVRFDWTPPNCCLAPKQIHLKHYLTSFATNVLPECHNWGYKPKKFLLASLATLFCTTFSWYCQWLRLLVEYSLSQLTSHHWPSFGKGENKGSVLLWYSYFDRSILMFLMHEGLQSRISILKHLSDEAVNWLLFSPLPKLGQLTSNDRENADQQLLPPPLQFLVAPRGQSP